ncbi:hypothetical protein [Moorena sp. SIO4G3]|uniref:hypothetical protein n=1 Tax=Moorena sp. SIO4G3 TaxID=2607821 RepID=UPI0025EC8081|nr:hypothetical protein [Moorena sp. SIO4G3]
MSDCIKTRRPYLTVTSNHEQLPWFPRLALCMADNEMHPVRASWAEFQHRPLEFEFLASELTLLIHDGRY